MKYLQTYSLFLLCVYSLYICGCDDMRGRNPSGTIDTPAMNSQAMGLEATQTASTISPKEFRIPLPSGKGFQLPYVAKKRGELVLLEIFKDRLIFTSLVSRPVYEEIFTFKPPTYYKFEGVEYVRNDLLFWGEDKQMESIAIDNQIIDGLIFENKSQIIAPREITGQILSKIAKGNTLRLEKHYWSDLREKEYPTFDISDTHDHLNSLNYSDSSFFNVTTDQVYCRKDGSRLIIWIESSHGSFALNGQALSLVEQSEKAGNPWLDSKGRPVLDDNGLIDARITQELINVGIEKCNAK